MRASFLRAMRRRQSRSDLPGRSTRTLRGDDRVAKYSSRGPTWYDARAKPDLVAPGHGLVAAAAKSSTLYLNNPALSVDDAYLRLNGTSMAAAVVSGTVALILRGQSNASAALYTQCGESDPPVHGVARARRSRRLVRRAHSGHRQRQCRRSDRRGRPHRSDEARVVMVADGHVDPWTVIDGSRAWAENIVWSDAVSFGAVLINQPAWSDNIVWGSDDNIVWGSSDNIVWGSNIVWGNNIVWASDDNIVWGSNIVWGNTLIGSTYGTSITWGMAVDDPSQTVWGTLDVAQGRPGQC